MKRTLACVGLALALTLPASASASSLLDRTTGAVTAGPTAPPSLSVAFSVRTLNGKPTKVKRFRANGIPFTCSDGTSGTTTEPARLPHDMKVNDKNKFHGKGRLGSSTMAVKGQLKGGGRRAKGTLRLIGPEEGAPDVTCDSGKLTWRVRRS